VPQVRGFVMRILIVHLLLLSALSVPACAASFDNQTPDDDNQIPNEKMLTALEQLAAHAPARSECLLYALLVNEMMDYSAHQYAIGNVGESAGMLKRSQEFTHKIRVLIAKTNKLELKNAQILLRRSAFRLTELLHASSYEDRPLVEETLAQLNQVQNQAMMQLFQK